MRATCIASKVRLISATKKSSIEATIIGVDFGAPRRADDQRRKIVAVAARRIAARRYIVDPGGFNARLLAGALPGWGARELIEELLEQRARVIGFDFPFSVPEALLDDVRFASTLGATEAFGTWRTFNAAVAQRLTLHDPLDFSAFAPWKAPAERARLWARRATDVAVGAQPPLKDRFQSTFQMTLLGNALLAKLEESRKYRILPFPGGRGDGEVIEVYPRATLRAMGLTAYKARPTEAMQRAHEACVAAGIALEVEPRVLERCGRYSSSLNTPDHDAADAFVALCTAILHAEGATRAEKPSPREGAIWVPDLDT